MTETGTVLKKLADATDPLFRSLDDAQRRRFAVLSRMMGPRGPQFRGRDRGQNDPNRQRRTEIVPGKAAGLMPAEPAPVTGGKTVGILPIDAVTPGTSRKAAGTHAGGHRGDDLDQPPGLSPRWLQSRALRARPRVPISRLSA